VLDRSGQVVASSTNAAALGGADNYSSTPFFRAAVAGEAGYHFAVEGAGRARDYYASRPVLDGAGKIVGVVVLQKSLDRFEADLSQFDRTYFLVDARGVVVATNRPALLFRALWPLSGDTQALSAQFPKVNRRPVLDREATDATWMNVDGERDYVRRRFAAHTDWSIVMLMVPRGIFASRVLGIIITLMMAIVTMVYLVGRERWVHDGVQLARRRELEELARNLDLRATTDPLTGLFNRSKIDHQLTREMARSQRYHVPLSLILYDIDHFKSVNDTYGHQAGDRVLVQLSRLVGEHIRKSDILARWGGEEFMILVPEATGAMAVRLAENLRDAVREFAFETAVTCSFGVAQFRNEDDMETFIARADGALYQAKINGRDRVELASPPDAEKADPTSVKSGLMSAA
jgi:diguanylate cyclase (GGDEF)-like protein